MFNLDIVPSKRLTCEGKQQATVIKFDYFNIGLALLSI